MGKLSFQNNHGGGIVTGMGEREVQLFCAEGIGLFPGLPGQDKLRLAGGQRTHGHVTGAYAFGEARAQRLDCGLLSGEPRGHIGNGTRGRGGGIAGDGAPFVVRHDAVEEMFPETVQ